jgi:hypothetical protein
MRPRARSSAWDGAGVGDGDGVLPLRWPEELSPEPLLVVRWQHLIIVLGPIIILITRAPITLLHPQAIMLPVTAQHRAAARLPIACDVSGRTIRRPEPISGQMVTAIRAPKARQDGEPTRRFAPACHEFD